MPAARIGCARMTLPKRLTAKTPDNQAASQTTNVLAMGKAARWHG
jgi:hypothetical protein